MGVSVLSSPSYDFWPQNVNGGYATLFALLFFLIYHFSKFRFSLSASPSPSPSPSPSSSSSASPSNDSHSRTSEVVSDADLKFLIQNLDDNNIQDEHWENVIDKRNNFMSYSAKCCRPKDGPLKYLSVTVFENCSTEILRDFYMANDYRIQWDKTIVEHMQLQLDTTKGIEFGRTIKKFPLLTPREYILAWRLWEGRDKTFYCFIKECEHPSAPRQKKYVRVTYFRSGWRIQKVPGRNACEIKMFHQEDNGLNVEMAKLAFSRGIWSYVCKMDNALRKYSVISHPQTSAAVSAVTLIQKVPLELEAINSISPPESPTATINGLYTSESKEKKLSRRPSKKVVAKGLLLLGGAICLSRGHSALGAKVAMAYILTKLHKRGASSSQSGQVSALNVLYSSLNSPSQLKGWKSSGGDPCGDSWKGITCSGSSVTEIRLSGIGVSGSLGYQLGNMKSVTYLDLSSNNLNNNIPYQLPPKLHQLDLSKNGLTGNVPYSISQMTDLKSLYLQNNQLTGSINVLAALPLDELNVENNKFTGWVPDSLKDVSKTGGNSWSSKAAPPPPPGTRPIAKRKKSSSGKKSSSVKVIIIVVSVMGALAVLVFAVGIFARRKRSSPSSHFLDEERSSERREFTPLASQELSSNDLRSQRKDYKENNSFNSNASVDLKSFQRSNSIGLKDPLTDRVKFLHDNEFANRLKAQRSTATRAIPYSLADLQTATANFATGRLLGEGTIGRAYRAKYQDGKVLIVKKIDSSLFRVGNRENFSETVANISRIRHTNVAELVGYCSEQGHHILVYDYYRNGSIHDFLHLSDDFSKPLTWNTRIRIALGTARAVEYLHEGCSPSLIHKNIKSSNILLDLELNPLLSDYGLANFHQRTSQNLGVGYNAPECTDPTAYTLKSDVYSFGVVMLELLTGRMPFDSKRAKSEQCLVRWAAPQLHDIDALAKMVDPALRGLYPPKSLSRFADIIALCVQPEPEFRPPMSEVVEALVRLVQRSTMNMRDDLAASRRTEDSDY
ncbi:hypothetical protein LWI28_011847 [Acer negundo]|uniref:Protein kinase domain-containing protein n=1 Tax=Acer negundo TaxID=4023 RepID=A0AAD5P087_ACENE|nr:hypothetical protein LWI28_011847 [Acer negundo]